MPYLNAANYLTWLTVTTYSNEQIKHLFDINLPYRQLEYNVVLVAIFDSFAFSNNAVMQCLKYSYCELIHNIIISLSSLRKVH